MNKLTTISTIKKAAPLALLAVVMSGSAFAGPGKGQGPKDKDPSGGAQASVDVFNLCEAKEIYNYDTNTSDLMLVVKSSITNTSGDTPVDAELSSVTVDGNQKSRGKATDLGGSNVKVFDPVKKIAQDDTYVSKEFIDICANLDKPMMDNSLNAEIFVQIDNSKFGTFSGKCDDDLTTWCKGYDEDGYEIDVYCEEEDESIVEIPAGTCY
jgi:hypothetical protein